MPYRKISADLKTRAIELYIAHRWFPADLAEVFGFSERSFFRWVANYRKHGSVTPPVNPLQGRPHILNAFMIRELHALVEAAPDLYLDEIQDWFTVAHNVGISITALADNLNDAQLTFKLMRKVASERDEGARQEFMDYAQNHWIANQLVFVDETSKDDRIIYRHYGRSLMGTNAIIRAPFCRGKRYSLVAALSVDGYIGQRAVEGSVDGEQFMEFIIEDIVCSASPYNMICF